MTGDRRQAKGGRRQATGDRRQVTCPAGGGDPDPEAWEEEEAGPVGDQEEGCQGEEEQPEPEEEVELLVDHVVGQDTDSIGPLQLPTTAILGRKTVIVIQCCCHEAVMLSWGCHVVSFYVAVMKPSRCCHIAFMWLLCCYHVAVLWLS